MSALSVKTPSEGVFPSLKGDFVFDPKQQQGEPTLYGLDKRVSLIEHMIKVQSEQLGSINANLGRIVWLILTIVIGGVLSLVIKGAV